jgi:AraC-like DNA-binding protein
MLATFALVMIGFSLCAAALLLWTSVTVHAGAEQSWLSRASGVVLLAGLAFLQWMHGQWLQQHAGSAASRGYVVLLFVVAAAFFLFFRGALQPKASERAWRLAFYLPALLPLWLAPRVALPLAFLSGAAYAAWLAWLVFRLRRQRARFRLELGVFAAHALVAFAVLLFGLASPWLGFDAFVVAYAILIGIGLFGALYLLLRFPDLPARAAEAVASAYAVSTLGRVDRAAALARLRKAMDEDKAYLDEDLSLARLAAHVELTPHQLSELVNTEFGVGFSRYVRGHRIEAAKRMLVDEPEASVLSIGLAVGFTSPSNFYAAFRELTGEVPGRYRRGRGVDGEGATDRR